MSEPPRQSTSARIRGLEERAFNAWPALHTVLADGWVMRFANGYTKRANSLNAWQPGCTIDTAVDLARDVYSHAGLPLVVRLSPLAEPSADAVLSARGFSKLDVTMVMTLPLQPGRFALDPAARIMQQPDPAWAQGFAEANRVPDRHRPTHDAMLAAIRWPAAFASLVDGARTLAFGLAVAERGKVGLFDIVTAPTSRRQGAGRRLVQSLLAWGAAAGCSEAYLQVVASNAPAIALYRELGFTEAYRYHYRVAP